MASPENDNHEDQNNVQASPQHEHQQPFLESSKPQYEFVHPLCPTDDVLQKNVCSQRRFTTHTITWSCDDSTDPESPTADEFDLQGRGKNTGTGNFVRNLKMGDCITIWAKARFPGWVNIIEKVEIDVYWAV